MKKINYSILLVLSLLFAFSSCNGDSYEKRVKKQKKAIDHFLSDKQILYTYPQDGIFEDNQYYKEPNTNVYFQVLNTGNMKDSLTVSDQEKANIPVTIMFDSIFYLVSDMKGKGDYVQDGEPIRFTYGNSSTYTNSNSNSYAYVYMSPTLVLPLQKGLGSGAIINILVPFQNGSSYQQYYYEPFFFKGLRYTYYKQQTNQ